MGAYNQQSYIYLKEFLLYGVTWDEIKQAATEKEPEQNDSNRIKRPKRSVPRNSIKNLNIEELENNLLVQDTGSIGAGVWAGRTYLKGDCIGIYVGTIINKTEKDKRIMENKNEYSFFMFELVSGKYFIDSYHAGNKTRFVNHSHIVNLEVKQIWMDNKPVLGFFATRDIEKYEELLYNYNHAEMMFVCQCRHYECVKKRQLPKDPVFACQVCGKVYTSKNAYELHIDTHTKPHKCTRCDQRFGQIGHLNRHMAKVHNISTKPKTSKNKRGIKQNKTSLEQLSAILGEQAKDETGESGGYQRENSGEPDADGDSDRTATHQPISQEDEEIHHSDHLSPTTPTSSSRHRNRKQRDKYYDDEEFVPSSNKKKK